MNADQESNPIGDREHREHRDSDAAFFRFTIHEKRDLPLHDVDLQTDFWADYFKLNLVLAVHLRDVDGVPQ
jgi:hypothetical protein